MIETAKLKELVKSYDWDGYILDLKDKLIALIKEDEDSELVCHTNLKANAELICKIMDADVEHRAFHFTDGRCENCEFKNNDEYAEPCVKCRHNYNSKFQAKPLPPRWIKIQDDSPWDGEYKCSECGGIQERKSKFCPNCGADMRGETNGR